MKISVVAPLYKCEPFIPMLTARLKDSFSKITDDFEIIYVNDASPLNDWEQVITESNNDSRVKGINFSRNFGQHYAITAGLDFASGDWVVVMDGDLQDQPEDIILLFNHAMSNNLDIVWGRRKERKHHLFKRIASKMFYLVFDYLSGYTFDPSVGNYSIISQKVVMAYRKMNEQSRAYPMFIRWIGFPKGFIDINHAQRPEGKSSYSLKKLFKLAFDMIIAYSNKPLRLGMALGMFMAAASLLFAAYYSLKYYIKGIPVPGFTSLIVSVWFIGGVIMSFLGLLGLYIGKIFDENKKRPLYLVKDYVNL